MKMLWLYLDYLCFHFVTAYRTRDENDHSLVSAHAVAKVIYIGDVKCNYLVFLHIRYSIPYLCQGRGRQASRRS